MKTTKTYTFYFGTFEQLKRGEYRYQRDAFTLADARKQATVFGDSFARLGKNGKINIIK